MLAINGKRIYKTPNDPNASNDPNNEKPTATTDI